MTNSNTATQPTTETKTDVTAKPAMVKNDNNAAAPKEKEEAKTGTSDKK